MKVVIVDYNIGNVQSIYNALSQFQGVDVLLTDDQNAILSADGLILPGVGAFQKAMDELNARNLPNILKNYVLQGKPFLGICLGMQLLFESSEEFGHAKGLGFIKGSVEPFPKDFDGKLPHIGWSPVLKQDLSSENALFKDVPYTSEFYFLHSYICKPECQDIVSTTAQYSTTNFCSSIQKDNIFACQFHPEKSAIDGLKILHNFIKTVLLCKG
ncbi:imidazole glycerol phosphate synthase subunit HisH [Gammaproteobacteria bacterium]|nr:imidazole glycerol phosphate synthase subunit HisH [Gammaproteobacteria bacterium]